MIVFDNPQLWDQFERHKAALNVARDRWLDRLDKSPADPERATAEAALKAAMSDLDLDIDLLWQASGEGAVPTD
jgi:hypothetical protein